MVQWRTDSSILDNQQEQFDSYLNEIRSKTNTKSKRTLKKTYRNKSRADILANPDVNFDEYLDKYQLHYGPFKVPRFINEMKKQGVDVHDIDPTSDDWDSLIFKYTKRGSRGRLDFIDLLKRVYKLTEKGIKYKIKSRKSFAKKGGKKCKKCCKKKCCKKRKKGIKKSRKLKGNSGGKR